MFTWKEIIDIAIQIENNGESIYRKAAEEVEIPALAEMLGRMAEEESQHALTFAQLRSAHVLTRKSSNLEKIARAFTRDLVADKSLSLQEADFTSINRIKDLIETSIEFEKDTVLFYQMLRQFVIKDPATTQLLDTIIEEEHKHITTLGQWAQNETAV